MLFQHSTVAQEILAGARNEADYRAYHEDWVAPFDDLARVITPSHRCWSRAALIMVRLVERRLLSPDGFTRSFLNDCVLAASARELGFVLVTRNLGDFALIRRVEPRLAFVPPWPARQRTADETLRDPPRRETSVRSGLREGAVESLRHDLASDDRHPVTKR